MGIRIRRNTENSGITSGEYWKIWLKRLLLYAVRCTPTSPSNAAIQTWYVAQTRGDVYDPLCRANIRLRPLWCLPHTVDLDVMGIWLLWLAPSGI
ncbi:hypothetical protein POX_c03696 [Penicillium oxalicum]|uniref:hypothetical protein n=1 Tax=Penicillium oxalicum TaxID=69781 RepID=UPI0020B7E30B|nr:hypothetical protein POX_c03696 [Penicillium oxalicum]KAI2790845.1 hypothetical protein POX_c03696 [Penicillium oxalicum]